jgi:hypothetical protein
VERGVYYSMDKLSLDIVYGRRTREEKKRWMIAADAESRGTSVNRDRRN